MMLAFSYLISALVVLAKEVFPVKAIIYGALDGDDHPYVGLMVAKNAAGCVVGRCSGTLLSSTVFLTAGHCTSGASRVEIWFDADIDAGMPGNGYPLSTGDAGGTPVTHPDYDPEVPSTVGKFSPVISDVGVVILDEHYEGTNGVYGTLPSLNQLDAFKTNKRGLKFTIVGYGLQYASPVESKIESAAVRKNATVDLIQINGGIARDYAMLFSNNAATGGSCSGDSGGPAFFNNSNVIAGVSSFGLNQNCAGVGGYFRMDRASALNWVMGCLEEGCLEEGLLKN